MPVRKWFLYCNDVFEGYAPNRAKARGWCLGNKVEWHLQIDVDKPRLVIAVRDHNVYKAEYKSIREGI